MLATLQFIILDSIVVSIPACHAGDRGSIPRRGDFCFFFTAIFELPSCFRILQILNSIIYDISYNIKHTYIITWGKTGSKQFLAMSY